MACACVDAELELLGAESETARADRRRKELNEHLYLQENTHERTD